MSGTPILPPHLCHCNDCRSISGSTFSHSVIYKAGALKIIQGEHQITNYESTADTYRPFCSSCGCHIYKQAPKKGVVIIYPNLFDTVNTGNPLPQEWVPKRHIYYKSRAHGYEYDDHIEFYDHAPKQLGGDDVQVNYQGSKL